ncbi:MAG TPA: signal recognition particle-docking protein FtsY [bacterium]|nr:signal recognition particle-docking protein FtsY [bacterium]
MKTARWSIMEWVFGGRLPRRTGVTGGAAADAGASRLDRAAEEIEAQREARERVRRDRERTTELERVRRSASEVRQALAEQEIALRSREGALQKDLGGPAEPPAPPQSFAERLRQGVSKTRERLASGLGNIVLGRKELDRDALEELEELLLTADMGPQTVTRLIKALEAKLRRNELKDPKRLKDALKAEVQAILGRSYPPPNLEGKHPAVVLFAGVNGTGKTTTIGKLGAQARREGKRVLLAAGDTFRAAAAEQLAGWAERADCDLFRQQEGANPSGVIYQAVEKGLRDGYDLVLCDTAGRLHTKSNLMEELKKIKRVMSKLVSDAPHETYLVLDANNGQNAIHQARDFNEAVGLTGLIVTKLDGTARGGVIVGIVNEFDLPVRYIGVGEGVDDLRPFDPQAFAASLFD